MYPTHIQKLVDHPKEYLTASMIAPIVGKSPATLRYLAKEYPDRLNFPSITSPLNNDVRFPKWPFLNAIGYYRND